jgi:hypothetical protein
MLDLDSINWEEFADKCQNCGGNKQNKKCDWCIKCYKEYNIAERRERAEDSLVEFGVNRDDITDEAIDTYIEREEYWMNNTKSFNGWQKKCEMEANSIKERL